MFDIILGLFLFLSPIIIMMGNNARLNGTILAMQFYQFKTLSFTNDILQLQFFEYGIILLFIIALMQKSIRDFKDKWMALFLGLCALSVTFYPKTFLSFIPIFLGILFYYLVVCYAKNIKKLLYPILLVSALNTFFAILQFFKIYWIYNPPTSDNYIIQGRYDGLMAISNHLGIYQALALPVCYAIHPLFSIIPLTGLLLSKSATGILAGAIGMVYLFYPKRKKLFINFAPMGLIALLGIIITFTLRNYRYGIYKMGIRLGIWIDTIKEIIKRPAIGFGLGSFSNVLRWEWAYNEYLEIAFCVGVLGLFFIFMFLKDRFKNIGIGLERYIASSCLIIVIICLTQPALHFARLTGTIIPLFAFLEILKRKEIL